jgi:hypothetical protein
MSGFTKIAVTVPTETYTVVERLRLRLGKSRSAAVALALAQWVRDADLAEADRRYIDGYLRIPEAVDEIRAVAAQATSHWGTWSPGTPSHAAEPRAEPRAEVRAEVRDRRPRSRAPKRSRR